MGIKSSKEEAEAGGSAVATAVSGLTDVSCSKDEMSTITAIKKSQEVWASLKGVLSAYQGAVNTDAAGVSKLGNEWAEMDQTIAGFFTIGVEE